MSKIIYAFALVMCCSGSLFASNTEPSQTGVYTLVIAIVALLVGVFNILWMLRIRLVHRVDLINQKEDLNLTMEGIKTELTRDIRHNRKELMKLQNPTHTDKVQPVVKKAQPYQELKNRPIQSKPESESQDDKPVQPKPKKKYYRRHKPSNKSGEQQKGNTVD
ncbi:MAG TPA: hypothetical protein DCQ26_10480 [Marinilabiliales bacterium]|jgi:hypothetical protein|nr:MAG: hypothetical protein A2W95_05465 [Bacteroidetes bacterium GWA2_40_14]OFX59911.1 MAG: hypothetical protein A2W84_02225 [Bacteroidetes bacterium GWC2_40_13]OFX75134.1 MAG: hypothetical protein A2W96_17235 [Bacteroidetes bacterium GWD2_40_43]OFX93817.1 MAG: hypothetical protein A2W97_00150 [Bacteroidetes bacterium GWE2_40_63]OFY18110.1 MAG: hypothetical protein A2W88_01180 [Bacteroidetes bacterium GWF2_40_13]OFZ27278.1 MAG: hypothetical protein A2437_13525 [Bacteroidetes bacterium RIFOXYC